MSERRYLQVVTSDGKVLEGTRHHRTRDLPRVEVMQLDNREQLCLKLLRYICESLASNTADGARAAGRGVGIGKTPNDDSTPSSMPLARRLGILAQQERRDVL